MKQSVPVFMLSITGACITLLLMSAIFLLSANISDSSVRVDEAQRKINHVNKDNLNDYDGAYVKGSEVVNIIEKLDIEHETIYVKVDGIFYNYMPGGAKVGNNSKTARLYDSGSYIVPSKKYVSKLVYSDEETVEGIIFEEL